MSKKLGLVITIILAMFLGLGLLGCSFDSELETKTASSSDVAEENVLIEVNSSGNATIYYDPDTNVMYLWISGYRKGGLTVMLNADGTPKLYKP